MRSTKIIKICSSSLCTCLHHMVILRTRNKITDFLMILAWASPFNHYNNNSCWLTVHFRDMKFRKHQTSFNLRLLIKSVTHKIQKRRKKLGLWASQKINLQALIPNYLMHFSSTHIQHQFLHFQIMYTVCLYLVFPRESCKTLHVLT